MISGTDLLLSLGQNVAQLFALVFLYTNLRPYLENSRFNTVINGFLFGTIGILGMLTPIQITSGIIIDGRVVVVAIAGAFGGWIPALLAGIIVSLYRLSLGGIGVIPGVGAILTGALFGALFHKRWTVEPIGYKQSIRQFLLLGIALAIQGLAWTLLLPADIAMSAFKTFAIPVIISYPLGTIMLAVMLIRESRRYAMAKLIKKNEEHLLTLVSTLPDEIITFDENGRILSLHSPSNQFIEYSRSPIGQLISDVSEIPKETAAIIVNTLRKAMKTDTLQIVEYQYTPPNKLNTPLWLEGRVLSLNNIVDGKQTAIWITRNITHQKQTERTLNQEQNMLRTLIDTLPDLIFIKDLQSRFVLVNKSSADHVGASNPEELIGKTDFDYYPEQEAHEFANDEQQMILTGQPLINKSRSHIHRANGDLRYYLTSKVPYLDDNGNIQGIIGVTRDINEVKLAEQALRENEKRYRTVFELLQIPVFIHSDGKLLLVNRAFTELMGVGKDPSEYVGKAVADLVKLEQKQFSNRLKTLYVDRETVPAKEFKLECEDGKIIDVIVQGLPIDFDGERAALTTLVDITERKALAQASKKAAVLQAELEKERELVALKDRFTSVVSHEFRTPLAIIQTSGELLQRHNDKISDERRSEIIHQIKRQIEKLTTMIDDVLTVSVLQAGEIRFNPQAIPIESFCKEIYDHVQLIDNADHQFIFKSNLTDQIIEVDPYLLQHILENLVQNAIKYSPGESQIVMALDRDDTNLSITITDNGIGISAEDQQALFTPFYRATNVGNIEGTGLGLSIVQEYTALHGGRIEVVSEADKGSTFTVILPIS